MREDPQTRWPAAFFGDTGARAVGPTLREQWTGARPDLVVYELLDCAAAVVAAELEIGYVQGDVAVVVVHAMRARDRFLR